MTCINTKELARLSQAVKNQDGFLTTAQRLKELYSLKFNEEDLFSVIELANKINKREKCKSNRPESSVSQRSYEIFCFGELKLFTISVVLYCHLNKTDTSDKNLVPYLLSVFRNKSEFFIKYHLEDLMFSKHRQMRGWNQEETELLKLIVKSRSEESEWKSVAFELFCQSGGKYYRSFAMCREKWISHINPQVKKTSWSTAEDLELFELIDKYGCRWALISRELKGMRSEHTVKNRYHSVCKSVRRLQKMGDSKDVNHRILNYLKARSEQQSQAHQRLNLSGASMDSKCSRERSREQKRQRLDISASSQEEEASETPLFSGMYEFSNSTPVNNEVFVPQGPKKSFDFDYMELKHEKKTNDRDEDEEVSKVDQEFLLLQKHASVSSDVRSLTVEQLDREYDRLMNFESGPSSEVMLNLLDDLELSEGVALPENGWLFDKQDREVYSWYDL